MNIRPIDIARKLKISTSSLRHYEEWGMIPPVERSNSGYRIYTGEHVAYFECIRAMAKGFGILLTGQVLKKVQSKDYTTAFWLISEAQSELFHQKKISEKIMKNLIQEKKQLEEANIQNNISYTIAEISKETGIAISTIRHWEKVGLITAKRDSSNHYRLFNEDHIRQILVIHALKTSQYSLDYSLSRIKQTLDQLDLKDTEKIHQIATDFQEHLDQLNQAQMHGIHYLYQLVSGTTT